MIQEEGPNPTENNTKGLITKKKQIQILRMNL